MRAFTLEARALTGELVTTHTRVYGTQVETVRRPEQLLPGLIRKPGAFTNSPLQHSLPEPLLALLTQAAADERRRLLRVLERATQVAGFEVAVTVMHHIVAAGRSIDAGEVEMVATRAREIPVDERDGDGSHPHNASGVDLSVYDRFIQVAA